MSSMIVITGFGYFRDSEGHIDSKVELPQGEHILKDGYDYVEVANRQEFDAVEVFVKPLPEKVQVDKLVTQELRELAIANLKQKGKIRADY